MPEQVSFPAASAEPTPVMGPTRPRDRIEVLDILRGFALFGILLVNMRVFSGPGELSTQLFTGSADRVASGLIEFFAQQKFLSLFTFLFGLGFALQMGRAKARGARFAPIYCRRLLGLLLIGVLHGFFLADVDTLQAYVLVGFLLLFFRHRSPRTILITAFVCLLIPIGRDAVELKLREIHLANPQAAEEMRREDADRAAARRARLEAYAKGTYGEIVVHRAKFWKRVYFSLDFYPSWLGEEFVMFLLGLYVGRRRIFENLSVHLPFIRKILWWVLGLGLLCTAVSYAMSQLTDPALPYLTRPLGSLLWAVGAPALSFFYASILLLLAQRQIWKPRLYPLATAGRMALTNYLLQSVICTTIFYSYGLGLYGQVGPAAGVSLTVLIFVTQIMLSVWWMRRFRFGPVEWLWRTLTYGKLQPMRVSSHA